MSNIRKNLTAALAAVVLALLFCSSGEAKVYRMNIGGKLHEVVTGPNGRVISVQETGKAAMPAVSSKVTAVSEAKIRYMLIGGKPHKVTIGANGRVSSVSELKNFPVGVEVYRPGKKPFVKESDGPKKYFTPVVLERPMPPPLVRPCREKREFYNQEAGRFMEEEVLPDFPTEEEQRGRVFLTPMATNLKQAYGFEMPKGKSTVCQAQVDERFFAGETVPVYRIVGKSPSTGQVYAGHVLPVQKTVRGAKDRFNAIAVMPAEAPADTKYLGMDHQPQGRKGQGDLPWFDLAGNSGAFPGIGRDFERFPEMLVPQIEYLGTPVASLNRTTMDELQRDKLLRKKLGMSLFRIGLGRYYYTPLKDQGSVVRALTIESGIYWHDTAVPEFFSVCWPLPHPGAVAGNVAIGAIKGWARRDCVPKLGQSSARELGVCNTALVPPMTGGQTLAPAQFSEKIGWEWVPQGDIATQLYNQRLELSRNGELSKLIVGGGIERYKESGGTARTRYGYVNAVVCPEFLGFAPTGPNSWVNLGLAGSVSGWRGEFKNHTGQNFPYSGNRWGVGPALVAGFSFPDHSWLKIASSVTFGDTTNPKGSNLPRTGSTQYELDLDYGKDWLVTGQLSWFPGVRAGLFGDNRRIQSYGHVKIVRTLGDEAQLSATLVNFRKSLAPGLFAEAMGGSIWAGVSLDGTRFGLGVGGNPIKAGKFIHRKNIESWVIEVPQDYLPPDALEAEG